MILGLLALLALSETSYGETSAADIADTATIEDGQGNARILFHWNAPINADNFAIRRATLKFEMAGEPESRVIRLRIHPVKTNWGAADVAWANGWSEAGGDYDAEIMSAAEVDLEQGASSVFVDVTSVLRAVSEQGQPTYGYLVTCDPADGIGLKEGDLSRFEGLAGASLEVSWRKVPAKPIELQQDDSVDSE
jgi:hypothetical protein